MRGYVGETNNGNYDVLGAEMKLKNIEQVESFIKVIDSCIGNVYITSKYGDRYNMKSTLTQYIAISALLGEHADELEIWCDYKEDEGKIIGFLRDYDM